MKPDNIPIPLSDRRSTWLSFFSTLKKCRFPLVLWSVMWLYATPVFAQWTALSSTAPAGNNGVMLLLPDGRVLCKSNAGGDSRGNLWDILTPNSSGSYVNGSWTTSSAMSKTRLYFISQVLADGRVFVAGGEYGTGGNFSEIYNPLTDTWSGELNYGKFISDANSEMLPDGKVLGAPVGDRPNTFIWDPVTNTFTPPGTPGRAK